MVEIKLLEKSKGLLPRKLEVELLKSLDSKEILVITGSRQVGKTSLCFRLIDHILNKRKISHLQVVYIDLEFPPVLSQVNNLYGEDFLNYLRSQNVNTDKKVFVFIDEIHYLENPSSFLKVIHDHFPQIKLIVSGSSSLEIKRKFKETLTGRKKIIKLNPLDFEEFLLFKKAPIYQKKKKLSFRKVILEKSLPDLSEIKFLYSDFERYFNEFLIYGGYPGVVLKESNEEKKDALFEIYGSYIRRDIKDFAVIENINAFNRLVELLSSQIGSLVNFSELTTILGVSRPTLENYLFLLEQTFIIKLLKPFFTNRRQEIIKSPKIFFYDQGLRNAILRNFDSIQERIDKGMIFENCIFTELKKNLTVAEELLFWRSKSNAEVDFLLREKEILPIEVKLNLARLKVPSGMRSFIVRYTPSAALVINNSIFSQKKIGGTDIFFIPAWAL